MTHPDDFLHSRSPVASGALLSAALGGLLCLATSCHSNPVVPSDTGANADTGVNSDAAASPDTIAPVDVATADVTAPVDAMNADAMASLDAAIADATAPPDAPLDAADVEVGCDVSPDRVITYSDAAPDTSLEAFTALCNTAGGHIEIAPHCGGMNTCAGFSYDYGTGVYTEHTCAGLDTCGGYSCVIP